MSGTPDHNSRMRFVVYYTKGLGDLVLDELLSIVPNATIIKTEARFGIVEMALDNLNNVRKMARTIDDFRLLLAGPATMSSEADFVQLCVKAATSALNYLNEGLQKNSEPWSATLSARNPVWLQPPPWDPAPIVARYLHSADIEGVTRQPVDLRIQVDKEIVHISLNLWDRPLGKRSDEEAPVRRGALRPTIAASLVRLAIAASDQHILRSGIYDPFCGTGTIVAEALRFGAPIFASDIDGEAVALARDRLRRISPNKVVSTKSTGDLAHIVFQHDVLRGFPSRVNARIIVSNLPWGKQVKLERRAELFDATAALLSRVILQGGVGVLLTTHEEQLVGRIRKQIKGVQTKIRRIGLLGQTPAIVSVHRNSKK